ncbi:MAG: 2,3-dihydro-2,3-dihydroxybenzoate dehydrogenase [Lautropia sp.]|nr:2,3-dihydro-2,3-dihydroxybenzoate dehydrogenase [Lautropia sp.]
MTDRFTDKKILVTGTAQGIGLRIAQRFVQAGAEVIGLDRQPAAGGNDGKSAAHTFEQIQLDLTDTAAIARVCEQLKARWPTLDVLVNAAGVLRMGGLDSLTSEDWDACLDVNVTGPFHLIQQWAPVFKAQRRGAIVNIASNAAVVPRIGMLAYCTSKAAMVAMSQTVALELAPFGVRCNIVSPGSTDTPMLAGMLGDPAGQRRLVEGLPEQYKLGIPLGKIGKPDDVADAVLFLASDQAGHITMQQIVIDGGATLGAS